MLQESAAGVTGVYSWCDMTKSTAAGVTVLSTAAGVTVVDCYWCDRRELRNRSLA